MSFFSRLTRKANTSQMETIKIHPVYTTHFATLNTKYQTAYKKYIAHKSPEINALMIYINRGVRLLNELVDIPSSELNNEVDTIFVSSIIRAMNVKLDIAIPPSERREKYNELSALILELSMNYNKFVKDATGAIVPDSRTEFQRKLAQYTSGSTESSRLNAANKASRASLNAASTALASAERKLGSRLNAENAKSRIVTKGMNAATGMTGMYNNGPGPVAGSSFNAEVEALMRASAAKVATMRFPEVPTHPVVGRRGGRRTRRASRRRVRRS